MSHHTLSPSLSPSPSLSLSPSPPTTSQLHRTSDRDRAIEDSPGSSVFDLPTQPVFPDPHPRTHTHTQTTPTPHATTPADRPAPDLDADDLDDDGDGGHLTNGAGPARHQSLLGPSFLVVSGGTGCNSICAAFAHDACYVLPVSDDGGSSSEIIRVFGGPSIGDIRSRLVRLIPTAPPGSPLDCIKNLLAYRLPADCSEREARDQWRDIVEGRSTLWTGIPNDKKELIRGFLVYFESAVLKRAHKSFSFQNGSVGNYFLAAAQEFFRSLPSAIFLFSSITNSRANILPVIVTNHTVTIAAELEDGTRLVGQCEISHPVPRSGVHITLQASGEEFASSLSPVEDLGGVYGKPRNILFEAKGKEVYEPLEARIARVFYINAYGNEVHPSPNQDYLANLGRNDVLVYSCGSLWTSIIPCLALRGVANAVARSRSLRAKILLLNAQNDRETDGYAAEDYIKVIARTLNTPYHRQYDGIGQGLTTYPVSAYVTHMLYLRGTSVPVDVQGITAMGVKCVEVVGAEDAKTGLPRFTPGSVRRAILGLLKDEGSA